MSVVETAQAAEISCAAANTYRMISLGGRSKRLFDVALAITALVILFPLLICIALYLRISSPGPILFRQRRIGLNGLSFDCLKYRTMVVNAESMLEKHLRTDSAAADEWRLTRKLKSDPRITPAGAFLRKSSLDELPQLFNIIKGDMSIVGPRPIVSAEVVKYAQTFRHYKRVRPGLTGLWQIGGRNDVSYRRRVAFDRLYVTRWSFLTDFVIVFATIPAVMQQRGSS